MVVFCFYFVLSFFFATLNHVALKTVTGLTLKEGIGRISFRPGRQVASPAALVMRSKQLTTRTLLERIKRKEIKKY